MANELQNLLTRIQEEGFQKADQDRDAILAEAKKKADEIISQAEERAHEILNKARQEADMFTAKGTESLRQAARDTILSLRSRLQERMGEVSRVVAGEALDVNTIAGIISTAAKKYLEAESGAADLTILLSEKDAEKLSRQLLSALRDNLKQQPEISPASNISGGFKIKFSGDDLVYDFSDKALGEVLAAFLNPKLAELVKTSE